MNKTIGIIGTQSSTINCINGLISGGYKINHLITLPSKLSKGVADYQDLQKFATDKGISLTHVESYGMNDEATENKLNDISLDMVTVVGWQRLIPEWLLKKVPLGVYGMHGSSLPLPKGRGRSPLNWSILQYKDRFYTYLFRYDAGVDSGEIVDVQRFDICSWDTIQSLQHKNTVSQYLLLLKNLPMILSGKIKLIPQDKTKSPSYYPKRVFEDGAIDWKQWTAREIYALIRSVTRPYNGAYTMMDNKNIMIWRAVPFDSSIQFSNTVPGQIVDIFSDNSFIVQCFVDTLMVLEYEPQTEWKPEVGRTFTSIFNSSWLKLARMKTEESNGKE